MATIYWLGRATAVAQVHTASIDSVDGTPADNTFTVTIGGVAISQVGDTDVATTAAALVVKLNATTAHPYFTGITWTNPSAGTIVGTADTAGCPFVAALTETGAGTGAVTDFAATTASAGPNHWDTADNWSGSAVPVADDDVVLRDSDVNICWGLAQSAVLDSLIIEQTYAGRVGLRYQSFATSADGETVVETAAEYREHYLDIEVDGVVRIGEHYGPSAPVGSDRIKLDLGVQATTVIVHSTSRSTAETGKPAVRLLLDSASSTVYVRSAPGGVGIAADEADETSTLSEVSVSEQAGADTFVQTGDGVALTTWKSRGSSGTLKATGTVTTVSAEGGTLRIEGEFAITTLNVEKGATTYPNNVPAAGAAIGTVNHNGGHVDGKRSNRARTWTTYKLSVSGGGTFDIDPDDITLTNEVELVA